MTDVHQQVQRARALRPLIEADGAEINARRELTPAILNFVALAKAQRPLSGPLTYCELGCGQGFSANLLAAANPDIQFHATDFNPLQVARAHTDGFSQRQRVVALFERCHTAI